MIIQPKLPRVKLLAHGPGTPECFARFILLT